MAETPKGGVEVWAAGIGRKSNAQYGSDLMVEVLRELGIKYIALNPGASYRGLHDSMVNFEPGKGPEMIMCTHEEIAVAIANGYARATGEIDPEEADAIEADLIARLLENRAGGGVG